MRLASLILVGSSALLALSGCSAHRVAGVPDQSTDPVSGEGAISKVKAGSTTKAEVKKVLGAPWRTTNYGETYCGCPYSNFQEVWEYRGVDATGAYRLHIEFDGKGIARTVARVAAPGGLVRTLSSSAEDQLAHSSHPEGAN
jgi:outer membrane protein assembly factor BamE (lipoprotein component of BamABCDE complex)